MNNVGYHRIVSPEWIQKGRDFVTNNLPETPLARAVFTLAGGIALTGFSALPMVSSEASQGAPMQIGFGCSPEDCLALAPGERPMLPAKVLAAEQTEEASPPRREIPPIEGINPVVNERMRAMQITPASMEEFLSKLDVSQRGVIQQTLAEFNPHHNKKTRAVMNEVTLHTMAGYYDDEGKSETPRGPFNVQVLAKGMAASFGDVLKGRGSCCGTQSAISRDAQTYLLTGMNDPVQHNPPYDSQEFGIEIEAFAPPDVKTAQWEEAAKMSLLKLRLAGNKDPYLLVSMIKGHGQRRQELYNEYLTTNKWRTDPRFPTLDAFKQKYPYKGDVLAPESELFRQMLLKALIEHPELMTMPLPNLS